MDNLTRFFTFMWFFLPLDNFFGITLLCFWDKIKRNCCRNCCPGPCINPNSCQYPLINYLETHADHANNPTMPTNAPMPSSQPQQPIQQVHVPAHVYFHRWVFFVLFILRLHNLALGAQWCTVNIKVFQSIKKPLPFQNGAHIKWLILLDKYFFVA